MDSTQDWLEKLSAFLPVLLDEHPVLAGVRERSALVLHGSTCRGVDDPFSDLDVYLILTRADLADLDARSPTRFIEFKVDGKPGHLNSVALEALQVRVAGCDLPLISELRSGVLIEDHVDGAAELLAESRKAMRPEVGQAFFFYHYFQMRNFHRTSDNPMERGDAVAVLFGVAQALAHALRAALVLDGEPYPYEKWLRREAVRHPTGQALAAHIEVLFECMANDALRRAGPERENPLSQALRQIRHTLIDAARRHGIDEPWLTHWWLHIDQAETATRDVRW